MTSGNSSYIKGLLLILIAVLVLPFQNTHAQGVDTVLYENFESAALPEGWNNQHETGTRNWQYQDGGFTKTPEIEGSGHPPYAYEGTTNALLHYESLNGISTRLVTPPMDLTYKVKPELTFWHAQDERYTYDAFRNDELRVYYKSAQTASWQKLAEYTAVVEEWQKRSIQLPDSSLSGNYYIAFEGKTNNGFGVCIDQVMVRESEIQSKYVEGINYQQASTDFVATRSENNPIVRMDINIEGNEGTIRLDSLAVTSMNTSDGDLKANGVKLFAAGDTLFSKSRQIAEGRDFIEGKAVFDQIDYEIPRGLSSVWVTYDVKADSSHQTQGHVLDAKIAAHDMVINHEHYPLVFKSPHGSRKIYESVVYENFETPSDWIFTGEFEVAPPHDPPLGGTFGNPDPARAYEGSRMAGTDITGQGSTPGDYENNLGSDAYQAVTPMLDLFYYKDIELYFYRWLNVDGLDTVSIDISQDNGQTWQQVWKNSGAIVMDRWERDHFDLRDDVNRTDSVRLRFSLGGSDDSWPFSGWNLDNIVITGDYVGQDVGISQWLAPSHGCGHRAEEAVRVVVKNYGGDPTRDTIPLACNFNGGAQVIRDTIFESIPVGGQLTHTFDQTLDLTNPGWYREVWVQTELPQDEATDNNRLNHPLFIAPTYQPPYSEDFEQNHGYWRTNPDSSIFEWGRPDGEVLDSAASGSKIWATNLSGPYRINDSSFIKSPCFNFSETDHPVFEIKIKGEVEKGKDGLALYYSLDEGTTWKLASGRGNYPWNGYTSNHIEGLNGPGWDTTTNSWMKAKMMLPRETAGQANVRFALVFATDPYNPFEGYGIDDIKIYEAPSDVGVSSMAYPKTSCELSPRIQPKVYVRNDGPDTLSPGEEIPLGMHFNDRSHLLDTLTLQSNLAPGDSTPFTFSRALDMSYGGQYPFQVYTSREDNPYFYGPHSNDTLTDTIAVMGMPRYDMGRVVGTPSPVDTTLDAGAGYASYTWNTGANTRRIDVNSTGWYRVTVENDTGCTATDSVKVVDSDINTGITQIITPVEDACQHDQPLAIEAEISNMGLSPLAAGDTLPLGYQINDQAPVYDSLLLNDEWPETGSDSTLNHTFDQKIDLSRADAYRLKFFTNYPSDYNRGNDTAQILVNTWGTPDTELQYDTLITTRADTLTLDAGAGFETYTWQDGTGGQTFSVQHNRSQWYKVTVTDGHGCGEDSDSTHIIARDVGVDSLVYPNSSCSFTDSEQARVQITNYSADSLLAGALIPVRLRVDGTRHRDTLSLSNPLMPDSSTAFTLNPAVDLSAEGPHPIMITTAKEPDANPENDSLRRTIHTWGHPDVELTRDVIHTTLADTITLDAGEGFESYLWQDGSTSQTYQVSRNESAAYSVQVTGNHGCGNDSDTVHIYTYNFGVTELMAPVSDCRLSSSENLKVQVKNFSYDTLAAGSPIPLGYQMEDGTRHLDTAQLEDQVLPGQSFTHIFTDPLDMSSFKTFRFKLFTDHRHDVDRSNDTLLDAVKAYGYPKFSLNYDTLYTTRADTVQLRPNIEENAYLWQDGSTNPAFDVTRKTSRNYHLTITDLHGCSYVDTARIMTYDLKADSILNPSTACQLSENEPLKLRIRNKGADTLQEGRKIRLGYHLNDQPQVEEKNTLNHKLYPDSSFVFTFSDPVDLSQPGINHAFSAYVAMADDANKANDTLQQTITHYSAPQIDLGPDTLYTTRPDTLTLRVDSGYAHYQWQDGSTGPTYEVTSREAARYYVEVTNLKGCQTADTAQISLTIPDISISRILSPGNICRQDQPAPVQISLKNNGNTNISRDQTLAVSFRIDNHHKQHDTLILKQDLLPHDSLLFEFSDSAQLEQQTDTYKLQLSARMKGDARPSNNRTTQTFQIYPVPELDLGDTIYTQLPYEIDPGNYYAYQWQDGSTSETYMAEHPGKYRLTVFNQYGCPARDEIMIFKPTSYHRPPPKTYSAKIYPNPARNHMILEVNASERQTFHIKLIANQGYPVKTIKKKMKNEQINLNTSYLPPGVYHLLIKTRRGSQTMKIILK